MAKIIEKIKNFFGIIDLEKERIEKKKLDAEIKYYEEKLGLYGRDNTWTCFDYRYINNKGGRRNYLENLKNKVENGWKNPDIVIAGYFVSGTSSNIIYNIILFFNKTKFNIPKEDTFKEINRYFKEYKIRTFLECDDEELENNYIPVLIGYNKKNVKYKLDFSYVIELDKETNTYFIYDTENLNWEINQLIKRYKL